MPPSDIEVVDTQSATPTRSFPEWTQEDDSDIDIASIAERQRVRFRAASVAGRQRYQSPPRQLPSMLTRRDVIQEAQEIRAILGERKLGNFAKGLGTAAADVAEGIRNSGGAAKAAFAGGGGIGDAANAAVGSIADGIGKGINAVSSAGSAVVSAIAGSESDSSEHEHETKTKPPQNDPPPRTEAPPSTVHTNDAPQVTSDPSKVTEAPSPPPPPPSPPKETKPPPPPSSSDKERDPPKTTDKPIDNIPPPKAEQPSSKPTDDPTTTDSPSKTYSSSSDESSDASSTSTNEDKKISLSTIIPGATVTSQSGTRLLLTPVLSSAFPAITSGAKKGTTASDNFTTTPFAVAPGPTTMLTSVSRTTSFGAGPSEKPYADTSPNGGDGQGGSRGGLSPGQGAAISMGVLVCVCSFAAVGFYFWRTRKQQRDPGYDGDKSFSSVFRPLLDRAKRGFGNVACRIPYIRDRFYKNDSWKSLGDPYGDFFAEKMSGSATAASAGPGPPPTTDMSKLAPITIQTTITRQSSIISQFNSTAGIGGTISSVGVSTLGVSSVAETSARAAAMGPSAVGKHLVAAPASSSNTDPPSTSPFEAPGDVPDSKDTTAKPAHIASQVRQLAGTNHGPKPSFSSITPQYNLTLPSTFGARRISDLSSLSSGFGDGDIVVPSKQSRKSTTSSKLHHVTNMSAAEQQRNRHSTATTVNSNGSARRDTVYTEASEDSPPRFRTVSSWVRQQTGRVTREKQREQDAADESGTPPPVPAIPPEQEFRLMMPDGEEPRRVEDTNAGNSTGRGDWDSQTKNMLSGVIGAAR